MRQITVVEDPGAAVAERLTAAAEQGAHIVAHRRVDAARAYAIAAEHDAGLERRDGVVLRRALRAARPPGLELRDGAPRAALAPHATPPRVDAHARASSAHEAAAGAYEALAARAPRQRPALRPRCCSGWARTPTSPRCSRASRSSRRRGGSSSACRVAGMEPQVPRVTLTLPVDQPRPRGRLPRLRRRQGGGGRARVRRPARPEAPGRARAPARTARSVVFVDERRGGAALMSGQFIGLDVGGTKIAVRDAPGRQARPTSRADHDQRVDGRTRWSRQLVELIGHAARRATPCAVGVGLPSIIEFETGRIAHSVNIPLQDLPLRELLTEQRRDAGLRRERRVVRGARRGVRRGRQARVPEPRDVHRRHRRRRRHGASAAGSTAARPSAGRGRATR